MEAVELKTVIGIDQSYTGCAYVIFHDMTMFDFGIIKADKTQDVYSQAMGIATAISDICTKHNPDSITLEGLAFGMTGNATRDLAGLLFTIITVLKLRHPNIPVSTIAPTSLKKFATNSGKATKAEMMAAVPDDITRQFIAKKFKKTTGLADLSDAYWLAAQSAKIAP